MDGTLKEYYEDCKVGDRIVTPGRTITEADVVMFSAFSSDWNAIHTDKHYAETTTYGKRIAHGMLGLVAGSCLLSRAGWFTFWPRSMKCITGLDRVRFPLPIFIGDSIYLQAEIVEMIPAPNNMGIITSKLRIINQHDSAVITGRIKILAGTRNSQS